MTLVEVLIGCLLTAIVGFAVYRVMSGARHASSMASTKAALRQDAQIILKHLERDISNSRAKVVIAGDKKEIKKTLVSGGGGNFEMEVPNGEIPEDATYFDQNTADEDSQYIKVKYELSGSKYYRSDDKKKKCLSTFVKEIKVETNYDGKIKIMLALAAAPAGSSKKIEHVERTIIAIRQAEVKKGQKDWQQRVNGSDASTY
jgi:Tfp pilus assembly protein PilE